jgi:hypothetical protein
MRRPAFRSVSLLRSIIGAAIALCASATIAACTQPVYDSTLGVTGVPVDEGSLAGTFAIQSTATDQANTILGPQDGGGTTYSLVTRTYDAASKTYLQHVQVCAVIDFDVAGLSSTISDEAARSVPAFDTVLDVDHATGAYDVSTFEEVWAVHLPDNATSPLPATKDSPEVYDMDGDGKPGFTVKTSGLVDGELYVVQRKTLTYSGVVRSKDESFGLVKHHKESVVLDATNSLLKSSVDRKQHPDPKRSWFQEKRIAADATCDTVKAAITDGTLAEHAPFLH